MSPTIATTASGDLDSSDPAVVRAWLPPKQLALLDKFLIELRLGRLSSAEHSTNIMQSSDRRLVTHRAVDLLRHVIGSTRWKSPAQVLCLLRGLGRELHAAGGFREPAIGNVVRRVMAAVREEAGRESGQEVDVGPASSGKAGGRLSLQSMLWALPQQVSSKGTGPGQRGDHQRQESFANESSKLELNTTEYPASYYSSSRPDLKQAVMEAIQEILTDLEDLYKSINEQATNHVHADEIILTYGYSKTVELFLKAAAKKRHFQVFVCEGAPGYGGHRLAKALADAGINTVLIPDASTFAIMARVNKVLLPAHAVLANGGLIACSGCNVVALAAHHHNVPVVCVTGMFKLCPMYPHEGQDTLNDLISPSVVVDYSDMRDELLADVEFVAPLHDYVQPEHVSVYVTNMGTFQPSFIYRLLAEYYHSDDWGSFEY
jgi:translation initiation factor eIF-2B subunit beta